MNDLISRESAIDAVAKALKGTFVEYEDIAEKIINKVPSAQPERKRGEWVPYSPEGLRYKCSECESKYDTPWHFCPNCGSYNGGESDDKG